MRERQAMTKGTCTLQIDISQTLFSFVAPATPVASSCLQTFHFTSGKEEFSSLLFPFFVDLEEGGWWSRKRFLVIPFDLLRIIVSQRISGFPPFPLA